MRKLHLFLMVLALCVATSPAFAWDFTMTGTFSNEYRYLTQMGTNGFFGPYDLIAPAGASEAPNLWTGIHFQQISNRQLSASSDVATHGMWADFDPEIRFNPAVRLRGRYRIGREDWGNISVDPIYYNSIYGGVNRKFTDGGWTMFWGTAQLPWGILAIGKRPNIWGPGLLYDGTTNRSTEVFGLVASYGGLRFVPSFSPAFSTGAYRNRATKTGIRDIQFKVGATYDTGPISTGVRWDYEFRRHDGPEGGAARVRDGYTASWDVYLKYNNGSVFTNAELAVLEAADYFGQNAQGVALGPAYIESYRYMIESGFMAGPMKVSNIFSVCSGGNWGDKDFSNANVNTIVFKPYSLLLVRNYGVGTAFSTTSWEGFFDNAWGLGSRVDYALAANLNMWASVFGAWRWNRATESWKCLRPQQGNGLVAMGPITDGTVPRFIPNDDLGWEVYTGIDWKLLEGLRITAEGAYFQPGLWWRHACPSSLAADGTANTFTELGDQVLGDSINPFRTIDPILAFYLTCNWEF